MVQPKKTKPSTPLKPRKTKSAPSSDAHKHVPPPKTQTQSSNGVEKREKGKPERVYVVATAEEETKYDEVVWEVKMTTTSTKVVKKPQSGEAHPSKKPKVTTKQSLVKLGLISDSL